MLTANNRSSLKDIVYSSILTDILSNEDNTMDILNEKELVERYGYSKTPIREALISLCNDGVLRSIPRFGYEIVRLTTEDVQDMLHFRFILEGGILSANYSRFTAAQIDRLAEIDRQCSVIENDLWHHWDWNTRFHVKMLSFCKNSYAVEALQKCMDRLKRAYAQLYWDNLEGTTIAIDTRNHEGIIRSLREKDLDGLLLSLKSDLKDFGGPNAISVNI